MKMLNIFLRGYQGIVEKLTQVGAAIKIVEAKPKKKDLSNEEKFVTIIKN